MTLFGFVVDMRKTKMIATIGLCVLFSSCGVKAARKLFNEGNEIKLLKHVLNSLLVYRVFLKASHRSITPSATLYAPTQSVP